MVFHRFDAQGEALRCFLKRCRLNTETNTFENNLKHGHINTLTTPNERPLIEGLGAVSVARRLETGRFITLGLLSTPTASFKNTALVTSLPTTANVSSPAFLGTQDLWKQKRIACRNSQTLGRTRWPYSAEAQWLAVALGW